MVSEVKSCTLLPLNEGPASEEWFTQSLGIVLDDGKNERLYHEIIRTPSLGFKYAYLLCKVLWTHKLDGDWALSRTWYRSDLSDTNNQQPTHKHGLRLEL